MSGTFHFKPPALVPHALTRLENRAGGLVFIYRAMAQTAMVRMAVVYAVGPPLVIPLSRLLSRSPYRALLGVRRHAGRDWALGMIRFKAGKFEQWCCAECPSHDRAKTPQGRPSNYCVGCELKFLKAIAAGKSKMDPMWMIRTRRK